MRKISCIHDYQLIDVISQARDYYNYYVINNKTILIYNCSKCNKEKSEIATAGIMYKK